MGKQHNPAGYHKYGMKIYSLLTDEDIRSAIKKGAMPS